MGKVQRAIPQLVIKRLTRYLTHLQSGVPEDTDWISSHEIAKTLGLTSSTVRQDVSHVNFSGVSKKGYEVRELRKALEDVLGANSVWRAVVVGAGNLGRALVLHEEFARRGFQVLAIFDSNPRIAGRKVGHLTVRGMSDMPRIIREEKVDIGIIAVPAAAAQSVADQLVASGVRGLLNLALAHVVAPRGVAVTDSRIVTSLMELTHAIKMQSQK